MNPLHQPARLRSLRQLQRDGLLDATALASATRRLRPPNHWFAWVEQQLLLLGTALVLAGTIFFFAYNWAEMGRFAKLGLIEAALVACLLAACWRGRSRLTGKVLQLAAAVLVGVLLAVFGQIYQTGADAYELFAGWALLILGWVIAAGFAALWVVWLLLVNTAAILYWQQVAHPAYALPYEWLCLFLGLVNLGALVLRETGLQRGLDWLAGAWLRGLLLTGGLVALTVPVLHLVLAEARLGGASLLTALAWLLAVAGGYAWYRRACPDMLPLAIIVMDLCVVLLTLIGHHLLDGSHDLAVLFLLFALVILGVVSGAALWLRRTAQAMAAERAAGLP